MPIQPDPDRQPGDASQRRVSPRRAAALRVAGIFALCQAASYALLSAVMGSYVRTEMWLYGLAGPFVVVEAAAKFRYHSLGANIAYLLVVAAVLVVPMAHIVKPGRPTLGISAAGILAWIVFGLLHSVHHM